MAEGLQVGEERNNVLAESCGLVKTMLRLRGLRQIREICTRTKSCQ